MRDESKAKISLSDENAVLKYVMQSIYRARKPLPAFPVTSFRVETVDNRSSCELWFMTLGCSHDRHGGCTMCNYGKGRAINEETVLQEVKRAITRLPNDLSEIIVTPSGSMLDSQEVSDSLRNHILESFRKHSFDRFLIETRADTLSLDKLASIRERVKSDEYCVEVGVECTDDWILRNVVNKKMTVNDAKNAAKIIHDAGMTAYANIGIGFPFLNEQQNINIAVQSVIDAFQIGFDNVVLFPYHVKPGTLLEYLWRNGRYHCVSLWSFIEVLNRIPPRLSGKTQISWYKNYYQDPSKILESPDTCKKCSCNVLAELDRYKNRPSLEILASLQNMTCECKERWHTRCLNLQQPDDDMANVFAEYEMMTRDFKIADDVLRNELTRMKCSMRK